jgi:3-methylcrotonyl-CoA carboxylase alpha subunit
MREADSAFGDPTMFLEQAVLRPRHIEVQILADQHGNVMHLFERDCSLQRRHQKVIEEAPAPGMDEATREAVCGAAVRAAKAVNYEGAGTIEFIADASKGLRADRIWFMEMNTRLQVEHPVTEEITGQDLVEWQLRVASGEKLPLRQDELSIDGWAIEARLYAEDPAKGFLPSVGRLEHFDLGDEGRIETGVEEGDAISPYYDPMIAKLVAWGDDRVEALSELAHVLDGVEVWPVKTNAAFLFNAVLDKDFGTVRIDTGFIERKLDELVPDPEPDEYLWRGAAMVALAESDQDDGQPIGFRLNAPDRRQANLTWGGRSQAVSPDDGEIAAVSGFYDDERVVVFYEGQAYEFDRSARGNVGAAAGDGAILAPMPGKVTSVEIKQGEKVAKGQRLLTLEAMKMEHGMVAPFDGVVAELNAKAGAQVQVDAVLAKIEKKD